MTRDVLLQHEIVVLDKLDKLVIQAYLNVGFRVLVKYHLSNPPMYCTPDFLVLLDNQGNSNIAITDLSNIYAPTDSDLYDLKFVKEYPWFPVSLMNQYDIIIPSMRFNFKNYGHSVKN